MKQIITQNNVYGWKLIRIIRKTLGEILLMKNNRISNVYPSLVEMVTGTISELVIVNIAVYHVHFLWISEDMDWDRRNTQDYV